MSKQTYFEHSALLYFRVCLVDFPLIYKMHLRNSPVLYTAHQIKTSEQIHSHCQRVLALCAGSGWDGVSAVFSIPVTSGLVACRSSGYGWAALSGRLSMAADRLGWARGGRGHSQDCSPWLSKGLFVPYNLMLSSKTRGSSYGCSAISQDQPTVHWYKISITHVFVSKGK